MQKTIIGLVGGAFALVALLGGAGPSAASQAAEASALDPASSFAELMNPIPNPAGVLQEEDEQAPAGEPGDEKPFEPAAYYHHYYHYHWWRHHWWRHHWWRHHWWRHHWWRRHWWHRHWWRRHYH